MIVYENLTEPTKRLLEPVSEFGKIIRYKINIQKSTAFLYSNNKQLDDNILKNLFIAVSKI